MINIPSVDITKKDVKIVLKKKGEGKDVPLSQTDVHEFVELLVIKEKLQQETPVLEDDLTTVVNAKKTQITAFLAEEHPDRELFLTQYATMTADLEALIAASNVIKARNQVKIMEAATTYASYILALDTKKKAKLDEYVVDLEDIT